MVNVPIRGLLAQIAQRRSNLPIIADRAALRRAVAKFHGLLRTGRNRKSPIGIALLLSEDPGTLDLPEEQL
jgi:hypothetical protein